MEFCIYLRTRQEIMSFSKIYLLVEIGEMLSPNRSQDMGMRHIGSGLDLHG
jgi:hypothetical protein